MVICSCANEKDTGIVKEAIDQDYLRSESYQSFIKRSRLERKQSIRQEKNFTEFVQRKLSNFEGEKLTIPAVINAEIMKSSYREDPANHSSLITLFGLQQIYDPLAKIDANNKQYYLFMTCKVASYKDCLIWFASAKEGELIQMEMLTTYMQTLTYSEVPVINITNTGIAVEVNRSIEYPLSSIQEYTLQYRLTDYGNIFRVQDN